MAKREGEQVRRKINVVVPRGLALEDKDANWSARHGRKVIS